MTLNRNLSAGLQGNACSELLCNSKYNCAVIAFLDSESVFLETYWSVRQIICPLKPLNISVKCFILDVWHLRWSSSPFHNFTEHKISETFFWMKREVFIFGVYFSNLCIGSALWAEALIGVNSFVSSVPVLFPLKTLDNHKVLCFQGVGKGCIGSKLVN